MLGPCRLCYSLLENNNKIDSGYLLSTRDLCGLEFIPDLIKAGVSCFKIEGRMKSPEYVSTVTRIYRKYIDLAYSVENYVISDDDIKDLLICFNRGGFSSGHLTNSANYKLVEKEKPNHMGIFLGNVNSFNSKKGYITTTLNENISIGDSISVGNDTSKYTISELMKNGKNVPTASKNDIVTLGRIKGDINLKNKLFKIASKQLSLASKNSFSKEYKKIKFDCLVTIKNEEKISLAVSSCISSPPPFDDINFTIFSGAFPILAINSPITKEKVISQVSKTGASFICFDNISVNLDDNLFIPNISILNELRRKAIQKLEDILENRIKRDNITIDKKELLISTKNINNSTNKNISVLLNNLNPNFDYKNLNKSIKQVYIPLKYFLSKGYLNVINEISSHFELYVYMPVIMKNNYQNLFESEIENITKKFHISGFVVSNISCTELIRKLGQNYKYIANYTLNVFNSFSINELGRFGINKFTISPELSKQEIIKLIPNSSINSELKVYGYTPIMHTSYCFLSKANKCSIKCPALCKDKKSYYLVDKLRI